MMDQNLLKSFVWFITSVGLISAPAGHFPGGVRGVASLQDVIFIADSRGVAHPPLQSTFSRGIDYLQLLI